MMEPKARNIIPSGIEPVDKLLGGLESGQSYLVHGEAAGKSLFGIKFLIEGLKRGENGALVIRYSPEDAVRRFARLGYDCLEDVYSGRLVILEYSNEIIEQISRLPELTPVLRELEWLLGETHPKRLIFDPVTHLVKGKEGNLEARVREFAGWAKSFGATVLFVANGYSEEVVHEFRSLVEESFRFEVKEFAERATRYIAFEKSPSIPDQTIEVDPSRGVFLLGRVQTQESLSPAYERRPSQPAQTAPPGRGPDDLTTTKLPPIEKITEAEVDDSAAALPDAHPFEEAEEPLGDFELTDAPDAERQGPAPDAETAAYDHFLDLYRDVEATLQSQEAREATAFEAPSPAGVEADAFAPSAEQEGEYPLTEVEPQGQTSEADRAPLTQAGSEEAEADPFSELLDGLTDVEAPLDLDGLEGLLDAPETEDRLEHPSPQAEETAAAEPQLEVGDDARESSDRPDEPAPPAGSEADEKPRPRKYSRAADFRIESAITARAVEVLLRPPEPDTRPTTAGAFPGLFPPPLEAMPSATVRPKDFNVLVIDDDLAACELISHTLGEYTIEVVHDGVAGLAKLISFKPDLVILDVDLPIIDGFKVLAHIRSSLNMPIIIISGSHLRASDRLLSAELGADYYMTKPFSAKELRQKARQLIARFRGITSWIVTSAAEPETRADQARAESNSGRAAEPSSAPARFEGEPFTPYQDFAAKVEENVKAAIDDGSSFSIVGVRLPQMTANGGRLALQLYELISSLARESDLVSTNPRNDLVILLADADAAGAGAFLSRLRQRVLEEMDQEPTVWVRSFPDLEEVNGPAEYNQNPANGRSFNRRNSDNHVQENSPPQSSPPSSQTDEQSSRAIDERAEADGGPGRRDSYADFLEHR